MKKILYSLIITSMFSMGSCRKDYLETMPTNAIPEELVFSTTKNALAALNGIHRALYIQYGDLSQGGQGSVNINMDVLGEDLVMTSAGNGWYNAAYRWDAHRNENGSTILYIYQFYYKLIGNANKIIHNVNKAEGPEEEKKFIRGEAYTYRGWAHFMLVQAYGERFAAGATNSGPAVPLMLDNNLEGLPRATVAEVYDQVNKDLDSAIINLEQSSFRKGPGATGETKSHFDAQVVKGIKARVALTQQNWAAASQLAREARAGYTLMDSSQYMAGFNDINNPEWMWGSRQQQDQTTYFSSFFAFMSANFGSTNIRSNPKAINKNLYNKIAASDVRKNLWSPTGAGIPVPPNGARYPYINRKFLTSNSSSSIGDVVNMRAAEMYLIEAEAKARLGQSAAAADVLYELAHARDRSYQKSMLTGQALVDEVLIQRRIELWGEGFRFFDLKRVNADLDRTNSNHSEALCQVMQVPAGSKTWQFLIPRNEINANPKVVQNPL